MTMRVRAIARGYYGRLLRRPGDVFTLAREADFSARWMEAVPASVPEQRVTAQQVIDAVQVERGWGGVRRYSRPATDDEDEYGRAATEFDPFRDEDTERGA
jgi:hypothetical protein